MECGKLERCKDATMGRKINRTKVYSSDPRVDYIKQVNQWSIVPIVLFTVPTVNDTSFAAYNFFHSWSWLKFNVGFTAFLTSDSCSELGLHRRAELWSHDQNSILVLLEQYASTPEPKAKKHNSATI